MLLKPIHDPLLAHVAYLIGCPQTGEAIIIDPARDVDRYIAAAAAHGLELVAAAETHIHADYLSGCRQLACDTDASLYLSGEGGQDWSYRWVKELGDRVTILHDGDTFWVGRIEFTVTHTPGHTPEHICFTVTDHGGGNDVPMGVLTGDFVFVGDMGRPDLLETAAGIADTAANSAAELAASARRFLTLDSFLQIWPAHGAGSACGKALGDVAQTTIGYEAQTNPTLKLADDEAAFVSFILEGQPDPPLYFGRMKQQNRDGVRLLDALPRINRLTCDEIGNATVLDTRPWAAFCNGHLPGSIFTKRGTSFLMNAGSFIAEGTPIVVVAKESDVDQLVRGLVRIGLDDVVGWIDPDDATGFSDLEECCELNVTETATAIAQGGFLLDVRTTAEFNQGHVPAAIHIPHTRIMERLKEIPTNQPVHIMCQGGGRSAVVTSLLQGTGRKAINIVGGYSAWSDTHPLATSATCTTGTS
jgi:hydroxyacylglutathione hydrolase